MSKTIFLSFAIVLSLGIMAGCAGNNTLVKEMSHSTTQSVFQEIEENVPPVPGYADLRIYSSLKTHKPGAYPMKDIHGTPDFKLLLNIDGQAVLLRGSVQRENSEPRKLADPEAGDGIRYRFSKSLRLKAGIHRMVVAFPDDGVVVERNITLSEGSSNDLVLEPIYKTTPGMRRPGFGSTTSFMNGIRDIRLTFNGQRI
ncbi:MAG: hypothetical protein AB9919_06110 [Geobacteraceae bacterium]